MNQFGLFGRKRLRRLVRNRLLLPVLPALLVLASAGCNNYYIPPPPVSVSLQSPVNSLIITTTDSAGNTVPATVALQSQVLNSTNTGLSYSVGTYGNYIPGGNTEWGTVSGSGVYTAPAVVPTPNVVTIQAVSQADPTQKATATITLLNPDPAITSISPNVVTAGEGYTLDIQGSNLAPGATVSLGGAQVQSSTRISSTEMQATVQINEPGLLSLAVNNPDTTSGSGAGTLPIRSQAASPGGSGAVAVLIADAGTDSQGNAIVATKAYVPHGNTLAVVNADNGTQIFSVGLPNGYTATEVAADPAHDQVVVGSASSNILQIVDGNTDQVTRSILVGAVTGTTTVNGATCGICSMVVDSPRNEAILDTANGYFSVNLTTGASSTPLSAPVAANFGYDSQTQRIFVPYASGGKSGVDIVNLVTNTVTPVLLSGTALYSTGPGDAAFDSGTDLLTVADQNSSEYLSLNFNSATTSLGSVQVPASGFTLTSGCPGDWNAVSMDSADHLGWFANQGDCVAVASMAGGAPSGAPGTPTTIRWAEIPQGPNGLAWSNTPLGQPVGLAVYNGPDGHTYGLALNKDASELLKVDLTGLLKANAVAGGADVNQVDPTQVPVYGGTASALTYITLR